ncbi:hypothetical protein D1007_08552 [Hordeum vulgare]|nr:hypothetical protein D1007_08552 [Hordeum vulgare]
MPTLRPATFMDCLFPRINVAHVLHLPKLKDIELIAVSISKEDFELLLCGCNALQYLHFHVMFVFSSLHVTTTNLRTIFVHGWCYNMLSATVFHDMVIENAPFLERLFVLDKEGPTRTKFIDTPKLKVLGYSCVELSELVTAGYIPVQKFTPTGLTLYMHIVKILALQSISPILDEIVRFLICLSCMEKLYIEILKKCTHFEWIDEYVQRIKSEGYIDSSVAATSELNLGGVPQMENWGSSGRGAGRVVPMARIAYDAWNSGWNGPGWNRFCLLLFWPAPWSLRLRSIGTPSIAALLFLGQPNERLVPGEW